LLTIDISLEQEAIFWRAIFWRALFPEGVTTYLSATPSGKIGKPMEWSAEAKRAKKEDSQIYRS
jgi:hypothetical protein